MKKKTLSILLALILALSLAPLGALAAGEVVLAATADYSETGLVWTASTKTLELDSTYGGTDITFDESVNATVNVTVKGSVALDKITLPRHNYAPGASNIKLIIKGSGTGAKLKVEDIAEFFSSAVDTDAIDNIVFIYSNNNISYIAKATLEQADLIPSKPAPDWWSFYIVGETAILGSVTLESRCSISGGVLNISGVGNNLIISQNAQVGAGINLSNGSYINNMGRMYLSVNFRQTNGQLTIGSGSTVFNETTGEIDYGAGIIDIQSGGAIKNSGAIRNWNMPNEGTLLMVGGLKGTITNTGGTHDEFMSNGSAAKIIGETSINLTVGYTETTKKSYTFERQTGYAAMFSGKNVWIDTNGDGVRDKRLWEDEVLSEAINSCFYNTELPRTEADYLRNFTDIQINPGLPVGKYWIVLNLYTSPTAIDLDKYIYTANPIAPSATLEVVVTVSAPSTQPVLPDVSGADEWAKTELSEALAAGIVPETLIKLGWKTATTRLAAADALVAAIEKATGKTMAQLASSRGWDLSKNGFSDTASQAVTFLKYAGVTNGVGDNRYDPNGGYTRAQIVTMIGRAAEAFFGKAAQGASPFTDVPDWAAAYVGYAAANGITNGVSATQFDPNGGLQNQHTAIFMLRAVKAWK